MATDKQIDTFLSQYDEVVFTRALKPREVLFVFLPDITGQIDLPAKMIPYFYGQKYA